MAEIHQYTIRLKDPSVYAKIKSLAWLEDENVGDYIERVLVAHLKNPGEPPRTAADINSEMIDFLKLKFEKYDRLEEEHIYQALYKEFNITPEKFGRLLKQMKMLKFWYLHKDGSWEVL